MRICRKNLFLILTLVAFFVSLTSCSKTSDSGYKYPRNFPKECIAVYDRWWVFIDKMKVSGRFEEESIKNRKKSFEGLLEGFKNPPAGHTPPMEEYIQGCQGLDQVLDRWTKTVENMDNMSNEELARSVGGFLKPK